MSKDRQSVTCNGRAAFYASMWNDFRQAAMDCGWALGLHGSLNSDMDIMAMPWVEGATSAEYMIQHIIDTCFDDSRMLKILKPTKEQKPNGRVSYAVPIFSDFFLDISIIER